ncbi:hypothetical protein AK812_SmicGene641 [Symbiodinium microadriaticum]|uniref:Uncharacterized protein n=1 Tax=Symbiodinium microadriaticum TaxID=2951 RepID=A0A1Q9F6A0_SYMMI|nr:hypothetical protein AK812_SmicGene641 [Symbiodinium microadriaticum]
MSWGAVLMWVLFVVVKTMLLAPAFFIRDGRFGGGVGAEISFILVRGKPTSGCGVASYSFKKGCQEAYLEVHG